MPDQSMTDAVCQSCGMPLQNAADFGTLRDGSRADEYCRYCFVNGAFTDPGITLRGMTDLCVRVMTQRGVMAESQARALMTDLLPRLTRWRTSVPAHTPR